MNKFAEHIKGQISKSAATVKELEELAKKYEEDLRGLGYTNMQVDPYFAYGQYGFYFNFMREDGKPGQKFTGLDTKNNTKLNLRNAYYDLINRKNWYLKRQAKQAKTTKTASDMTVEETADNLMGLADKALENAGLLYGGYTTDEERRKRIDAIKDGLKGSIKFFRELKDKEKYKAIYKYIEDNNFHTLNVAIKELLNEKQATKCAKVNKKANFLNDFNANVLEINTKQLEQIRDTAKDMGDEIWAKINGKIEKIIAYGYDNGKLKIVYREPYYGEEEIKEMYDNADEVEYIDFETLELQKESSKSANLTKKAGIDQRLSYGHFIKEEDENKLPKFNTLEDIKKYIKSTNRFPDNFFL